MPIRLSKKSRPFDFVFSDADKDWYIQYFKDVHPKLKKEVGLLHNATEYRRYQNIWACKQSSQLCHPWTEAAVRIAISLKISQDIDSTIIFSFSFFCKDDSGKGFVIPEITKQD